MTDESACPLEFAASSYSDVMLLVNRPQSAPSTRVLSFRPNLGSNLRLQPELDRPKPGVAETDAMRWNHAW